MYPPTHGSDAKQATLRRMKLVATGLLLLAGAIYVAATVYEPRHPWLYYVRVTAEAAMVGAVADWFAVTALFHHPFNLRFIPHTAIIPRSKGRIAAGLADFMQQNFLSSAAVVARIAEFQPAQTLCRWLLKPDNAQAVASYAVRLLTYAAGALDDARIQRFLLENVTAALRRADVATAAAHVLDVLTEDNRHHALLEQALAALDEMLADEQTQRYIATEIASNAPLMKWFSDLLRLKLDEKLALRIVGVAVRKIAEVRQDRDHDLRRRFDAYVADFVQRLKADGATRAKVFRIRDELLDNPALGDYLAQLWREFRAWLDADLRRTPSAVHARIAALARAFGGKLERDADIRQWIDEQILTAIPPLVEEHRAKIGRFIEDQINGWQEQRLVAELERHIGPDLQYIRINGTLVGGLAGLLIALATQLLH